MLNRDLAGSDHYRSDVVECNDNELSVGGYWLHLEHHVVDGMISLCSAQCTVLYSIIYHRTALWPSVCVECGGSNSLSLSLSLSASPSLTVTCTAPALPVISQSVSQSDSDASTLDQLPRAQPGPGGGLHRHPPAPPGVPPSSRQSSLYNMQTS